MEPSRGVTLFSITIKRGGVVGESNNRPMSVSLKQLRTKRCPLILAKSCYKLNMNKRHVPPTFIVYFGCKYRKVETQIEAEMKMQTDPVNDHYVGGGGVTPTVSMRKGPPYPHWDTIICVDQDGEHLNDDSRFLSAGPVDVVKMMNRDERELECLSVHIDVYEQAVEDVVNMFQGKTCLVLDEALKTKKMTHVAYTDYCVRLRNNWDMNKPMWESVKEANWYGFYTYRQLKAYPFFDHGERYPWDSVAGCFEDAGDMLAMGKEFPWYYGQDYRHNATILDGFK